MREASQGINSEGVVKSLGARRASGEKTRDGPSANDKRGSQEREMERLTTASAMLKPRGKKTFVDQVVLKTPERTSD